MFVVFVFGKINFVHWHVLGLTCSANLVTVKSNHVKEALVDINGVTVHEASLP